MTERNNDTSSKPALDLERAYAFYREAIIGSIGARSTWYEEYGFRNPRTTSGDWEVFGAILLRQRKSDNPYGHDLEQAEVKSCALPGSSFEYQYHKHGGLSKLDQEQTIQHIFVVYAPDYLSITVYLVNGMDLKDIFDSWRAPLSNNYQANGGRQRFRKSIPLKIVVQRGQIIMRIKSGVISEGSIPTGLF